ncbi:hypothetical protein EDD85DRAFT_849402 [Armillaria nabsnona]|nr:hypothetical protein EDD85DRAFT_849402 [Armillaria nabsnona]
MEKETLTAIAMGEISESSPSSTLDLDLNDPETLRSYYENLLNYREREYGNSLTTGWSFMVTLNPYPSSSSHSSRPLPTFANKGGSYILSLSCPVKPYRHEIQYSQIWIADVFEPQSQCLGQVILKIYQPSLMPLPDIDDRENYRLFEYVRPGIMSSTEDNAYGELQPLQGTTVPYYYGMYTLTMPNGEDADVLIMEYVKGETLEQWLSGRPEHTKPEDLGNADVDYVADTKIMFKKVLTAVHSINRLGVAHRDVCPSCIILTPNPSGTPVFTDFALAACNVDLKLIRRTYENNIQAIDPLRECCQPHRDGILNWAKEELANPSNMWIRFHIDQS